MKKHYHVILAGLLMLVLLMAGRTKAIAATKGPNNNSNAGACISITEKAGEQKYIFYNDIWEKKVKDGGRTLTKYQGENISYDAQTNTLTLNNYIGIFELSSLYIREMGDDFKIKLVGYNCLGQIEVVSAYDYSSSVTFTGKGKLSVFGRIYNYPIDRDNEMPQTGQNGKIKFNNGVTVVVTNSSFLDRVFMYQLGIERGTVVVEGTEKADSPIILGSKVTTNAPKAYISVDRIYNMLYYTENEGEYIGKYVIYSPVLQKIEKSGKYYYYVEGGENYFATPSYLIFDEKLKYVESLPIENKSVTDAGYKIISHFVHTHTVTGDGIIYKTGKGAAYPVVGEYLWDEENRVAYKVTKAGTNKKYGELEVYLAYSSIEQPILQIPATISFYGAKFKVTSIGENAFANSVMDKVIIGKNVKTIAEKGFYNAPWICELVIESTKLTADSIGEDAFAELGYLEHIVLPSGKYDSYIDILKEKGLEDIEDYLD